MPTSASQVLNLLLQLVVAKKNTAEIYYTHGKYKQQTKNETAIHKQALIIWIWTVTGTYLCIYFKPLHVCFVPRQKQDSSTPPQPYKMLPQFCSQH